ncbi:hypothetical protein RhiirC2_785957 [Rhizophagus irregularis]|uniref:Uncharacterized protein n=1 Tax=Rhizophagus irregularis TaxID=588596 RepID=A0A2N1MVF2_9GLOM|nr:hypothetical protein RhiirC2_785957 [Rhizophagus irregularis]
MTTFTAPSVINPDILPLPHPEVLAPSRDRPLSPNNASDVPVITQSLFTNMSLESSIHAHPLPISTNPSNNDKGKSIAFDVSVRQPSPDGDAAAIKSSPFRFYAAAYLCDASVTFKEKFTTNHAMYDEVDRVFPNIPLMTLTLIVKD